MCCGVWAFLWQMLPTRTASAFHAAVRDLRVARLAKAALARSQQVEIAMPQGIAWPASAAESSIKMPQLHKKPIVMAPPASPQRTLGR